MGPMAIERFEDIKAWQEARILTSRVHSLTASPRFKASRALKEELERSAMSTMANIAEGFDCQNDREFVRFLFYSLRSASEVQSHLYVALANSLIEKRQFEEMYEYCASVKKLLLGFIRYLKTHRDKKSAPTGDQDAKMALTAACTTSDLGRRTSDGKDD